MVDAAVHDGVAGTHRNGRKGLLAEVVLNRTERLLEVALLHAERPGNIVAKLERQRQAVLAGLAVGMDAANVVLLVDPEISVGRHQLATGNQRDPWRQPPQ